MALRTLHIITDLDCGGAETMLVRLCSRYEAGEVAVLSLKTPGVLATQLAEIEVPVFSLDLNSWLFLPQHYRRLRAILNELKPAVYWGWMYHGALISSMAARIHGAPVLWNMRQTLYRLACEKLSTQWVLCALRYVSSKPYCTVYNSALSLEQHQSFGFAGPATVIPNGFSDVSFFASTSLREAGRTRFAIPADAPVIGHAARLHPMKDHDSFFAAVLPLLHENPALHVVCCGTNVSEELLPEGAPGERIHFCGLEPNMNLFYNSIDALCMSSSHGEGFPNVIGEAMLVGIPCVGTDVGSAREVIDTHGIVVAPGNVAALQVGLREALAHVAKRSAEDRSASRSSIQQRYSLDAIARRYAALEEAACEALPASELLKAVYKK